MTEEELIALQNPLYFVKFNQAIAAMRRELPSSDDQSNSDSPPLIIHHLAEIGNKMQEREHPELKRLKNGEASVTTIDVTQQTGIQKLIAEQLVPSLDKQDHWNRLSPDHAILDWTRELWKKHGFTMQAFKNFERLLCGSLDLPIILLQHPTKDNMLLSYDEMVAKTLDLQWLKDVLKIHGLKLDDIIIMDLFPLLNESWLDNVDTQLHSKIYEDVYALTIRILQTIKPSIILAFQFFVNEHSELWRIQANMDGIKIKNMMWDFSSARSRAKDIKVSKVYFPEQSFHVIQAFRPTEIWRKEGDERLMMDRILAEIVREVYRPCGEWKRHHEQRMKDRLEYHIQDLFDSKRNFLRALDEFEDFDSLIEGIGDDVFGKQLDANEDEWDSLRKKILERLGLDWDEAKHLPS